MKIGLDNLIIIIIKNIFLHNFIMNNIELIQQDE